MKKISTLDIGVLATALEIVQAYKREPKVEMGTCPHCEFYGSVAADFGYRTIRGKQVRQSWCKFCRASPASHPGR